jgi:hypothetical protein
VDRGRRGRQIAAAYLADATSLTMTPDQRRCSSPRPTPGGDDRRPLAAQVSSPPSTRTSFETVRIPPEVASSAPADGRRGRGRHGVVDVGLHQGHGPRDLVLGELRDKRRRQPGPGTVSAFDARTPALRPRGVPARQLHVIHGHGGARRQGVHGNALAAPSRSPSRPRLPGVRVVQPAFAPPAWRSTPASYVSSTGPRIPQSPSARPPARAWRPSPYSR